MRSTCLRGGLFVLIFMIAGEPACVHFFPGKNIEEPSVALERHVLCASVEIRGGWAAPGQEQSGFSKARDAAVCSFLRFRNLRGIHTLSWKWYDPSRGIIRGTDPLQIGGEGRVFESYIAWDKIIMNDERAAGTWTVAVFVDDIFFESKTFEIR